MGDRSFHRTRLDKYDLVAVVSLRLDFGRSGCSRCVCWANFFRGSEASPNPGRANHTKRLVMEQVSRPTGAIRLARYGATGVLSNAAVFVVFLLLIWLGVPPIWASSLCYGLGVTISYIVNRRWTFASQGSHLSDMPRFLVAYGLGLGVTLISMFSLLKVMNPAPAQLITIGITALAIYVFLHMFRFGAPANEEG